MGEKKPSFIFYIAAPGKRPQYHLIQRFVWAGGDLLDTDTDGNSYPADSTEWTELTVETCDERRERFDVDPVQEDQRILKIYSKTRYVAARVAYALAVYTGGGVSESAAGPYYTPDVLIPVMGDSFDLSAALRRNTWLRPPGTM